MCSLSVVGLGGLQDTGCPTSRAAMQTERSTSLVSLRPPLPEVQPSHLSKKRTSGLTAGISVAALSGPYRRAGPQASNTATMNSTPVGPEPSVRVLRARPQIRMEYLRERL